MLLSKLIRFALGHGVLEYRSIDKSKQKRLFFPFKSITPLFHYSIIPSPGAEPQIPIITTFPLYQLHHQDFLLNYRAQIVTLRNLLHFMHFRHFTL